MLFTERCAVAVVLAAGSALLLLARRRPRRQNRQTAHMEKRRLGRHSGLSVTVLGQGGAPMGDLYYKLSDEVALRALATAHESGIGLFDTSPWYGVGLSEVRFGLALHRVPRESFCFQTKVGRHLVPDEMCKNGVPVGWLGGLHMGIRFDYSADGLERQIHDTLQRTGLGYVDSLVIHDLEPTPHRDLVTGYDGVETAERHLDMLQQSGFRYLQRQRVAGKIKAFGAGVNIDEDGEDASIKRAWNRRYVERLLRLGMPRGGQTECGSDGGEGGLSHGIDFLLLANMHSLLSSEAQRLGILDDCLAAGVSVIVGGPFSSGILATGADPHSGETPKFNYLPASDEVRAHVRRLERVCGRFGVPLIAASLQYPLRHPAVAAVIPGGATEAEVLSNVSLMNVPISEEFWGVLEQEGLLPPPY
jgi:D-threo-aldose 1-dehydrogenase